MGDRAERGFTLLETIVALGIGIVLSVFVIRATSSFLHWLSIQAQRDTEHAAIDSLVDRWRAEEDSAWAIFTPDADVNGVSNADGHEVDFFTRDAKYQSYFWAYNYNAQAQTLTKFLYSAPGARPIIDTAVAGVTGFYAHTYPVTALQDSTSKIYSPLYAGATLQPGAVRFYGASNPKIAGGNQITYVRIQGTSMVREMQLSTLTAPTGFTIVLNYTPAPTATPKSALQAWPAFIELPMSGQALQTAWVPPAHDVGYFVNHVLGGAIADAALSPCTTNQARAFTDSSFTTPLVSASPPPGALPAGVSGYTNAGGCVTITDSIGSNVELYEPGNTTALQQTVNNCSAAVSILSENPGSAAASNVGLRTQGGNQASSGCSMTWEDQQSQPTSATVTFEVSGCVAGSLQNTYTLTGLGQTCNASDALYQGQGNLDCSIGGSGGTSDGATTAAASGPGVITSSDGSGGFTVQRTGSGTITVRVSYIEKYCAGSRMSAVSKSDTVTFGD